MSGKVKSDLYKSAGVDIDLASTLLDRVKAKLSSTKRPEMLCPIGGFGGLFQLDLSRYEQPVLVSSIDGVGTKLMVAMQMESYYSVGCDIVNHCVNDIAVQGAEPIYFLDYIGIGQLRSPLYEKVLEGIADACKAVNCSVLGGETAEMPGMYGNDFDLVGVITGVVEKKKLITGEHIAPGHVAVGLASSGLHTNGFSLARKVLFEQAGYTVQARPEELGGETVGEALLKSHVCYWPILKSLLADSTVSVDGVAHITGGGLYDNTPRILPDHVDVIFDRSALPVPPIMQLIVAKGNIDPEEAYRVFNMGVGMVIFVPAGQEGKVMAAAQQAGISSAVCGKVVAGNKTVVVN
ncbi:MAG: phosphoribosylformylglycinamidine cyclo-ligase [Victivallales bacterium]|nr:phosphoribosylformylglycinamidine cyclo-ligase [Victivallales bacterium]